MSTLHPSDHHAEPRAVFLAEDDDDCRIALSRTLEREGCRVVSLGNGGALLARLHALREAGERPALVIADQRMPGMTGTYVLERMQQWGLRIPLVLITGFDDPDVLERAQALGAAVLCKPVDGDDLCRLVRHYLARPGAPGARCAACGSKLNLRGSDTGGEVFFCGDCHLRGHAHEAGDLLMTDFGGGD